MLFKSPEAVANVVDIQQKLPWRLGFLTYHQDPSGFLPTISTVCPGLRTRTTGQLVPGPERQLSGCPFGAAIGEAGVGGEVGATTVCGSGLIGRETSVAASVGFSITVLIVGKLQASIRVVTIARTIRRRMFIFPPPPEPAS
jgi:hypothetical protein